jgi:NTE family protein
MRSCEAIVLIFLSLLLCNLSYTQEVPSSPKVGLVLEGGSALGLAHIGVLRWFEEHRVPISYIAGTSMGGLVGGIYSTGLSTDELQQLIQTIDWDQVLQGRTPYEALSFRRKEDAVEYPNHMEFGLRKGVRFPEGYNSGQQVISILDRVALPYSDVHDFSDLPTPFACVAIDLVSSEKFVFRQGSLSLALRSTMSLPGIFTPVHWNGHIFADGGLLDNLPVDVAKSMGADLTVAVHLESARLDPSAPLSSIGVLGKSVDVVIAANELRSMENADILISVPLQRYNSFTFGHAEEIIKAGYDAAQAKAAVLSKLSVDEATWQAYLAHRASRRRTTPVPQFVRVTGTSSELAEAIKDDLQNNVGQVIDPGHLDSQLTDLMGEGRFASLTYEITTTDQQPGLLIAATEKSYSPPIVRPILLFDGGDFAGVDFSMGARITFLDFGSYRAELRNDIMVGTNYRFDSQYYRPFSARSNWFFAPNVLADYLQYPIYKQNDLLALYRKASAGGGVNFGYQFGRVAQLTVGYTAAHQSFTPTIGNTALLPTVSGRYGATTLGFLLNEVDDPVIPRTGQFATLSSSWIDSNPGAAHSYPLAEGSLTKFVRLSNPTSAYFGARGGTTFGNELVGVPSFSLGGTNNLSAYGENELLTNQYYLFQAGFLRRMVRLPVLLGDAVYLNGVAEVGKVFAPPFKSQIPGDGAISLVVNTIFGPVEVGGAVGAAGHRRVFFRLGRLF